MDCEAGIGLETDGKLESNAGGAGARKLLNVGARKCRRTVAGHRGSAYAAGIGGADGS